MKLILTLALSLLAWNAHALPQFKNKRMNSTELKNLFLRPNSQSLPFAKPVEAAPVELQPIRQARLKTEVYRTEIRTLPDGSFNVTIESKCIGETSAGVFDGRGIPAFYTKVQPPFVCPSEVDGQPVVVKIDGRIVFIRYSPFTNEPEDDMKSGMVTLTVEQSGGVVQFSPGHVLGRGLDSKSTFVDTAMPGFVTCRDDGAGHMQCDVNDGVYFSAVNELMDQP